MNDVSRFTQWLPPLAALALLLIFWFQVQRNPSNANVHICLFTNAFKDPKHKAVSSGTRVQISIYLSVTPLRLCPNSFQNRAQNGRVTSSVHAVSRRIGPCLSPPWSLCSLWPNNASNGGSSRKVIARTASINAIANNFFIHSMLSNLDYCRTWVEILSLSRLKVSHE